MNDDEIVASVSHKEEGNDVGVPDEDEVEYAEEQLPGMKYSMQLIH